MSNELKELITTLQGIDAGEPWEFLHGGKWNKPHPDSDPVYCFRAREIRLTPKPEWKLPAPPDGEEWHRTDWTQDMLPDGYRPLILGERAVVGDQFKPEAGCDLWQASWQSCEGHYTIVRGSWRHRTTRTLPMSKAGLAATSLDPPASGDDVQF